MEWCGRAPVPAGNQPISSSIRSFTALLPGIVPLRAYLRPIWRGGATVLPKQIRQPATITNCDWPGWEMVHRNQSGSGARILRRSTGTGSLLKPGSVLIHTLSPKRTAREAGDDPPDNEHTPCGNADHGGSEQQRHPSQSQNSDQQHKEGHADGSQPRNLDASSVVPAGVSTPERNCIGRPE
jgi:hypothetical protein